MRSSARQAARLSCSLALVCGVAGAADPAQYELARPGYRYQFPRDHFNHPAFQTEWWYYTGNLTGPDGGQYGYQLTFFRTALAPEMPVRTSTLATNQVYMAHFALTDQSIPLDGVAAFRQAHPEVEVQMYPATHGFNCDHRGAYDAPSAALARERSLAFLARHLA